MIRQQSPRGETIYWIGPAGDAREAGEGTDFHATANGQVSITPLQVDLTDHAGLPGWGDPSGPAGMSTPPRRFPLPLNKMDSGAVASPTREVLMPQRHLREATADAARRLAPSGLGLDSAQVRQRMVQRLQAEGLRDERVLAGPGQRAAA